MEMMEKVMGTKTRRVFTKEFKEEAVGQVTAGGRSMRDVARSLEIDDGLLSKWVRSSREEGADAFRGQGNRTAEENEIWRLKEKNRQLELELEFLKKVSRYFAATPKGDPK